MEIIVEDFLNHLKRPMAKILATTENSRVLLNKNEQMKRIRIYLRDYFEPIVKIDYGVFIIFFLITMLFLLTIIKNI